MKATLMILENIHKSELVKFERNIRISEPDIWINQYDEVAYMKQLGSVDLDDHTNNFIMGAFVDECLVARCDVIIYKSLMDFKKTAYIDWLYVDIAHRQTGIARALLTETKKYVEKNGVEYTYLFTAANEDAQVFYNNLVAFTLENREVAYTDKEK